MKTIKQFENIAYNAKNLGELRLYLDEQRKLETLADLHDTAVFYLAILLVLVGWAIICGIRYYLAHKAIERHPGEDNLGNFLYGIILLVLILGFTCPPEMIYLSDEVTDGSGMHSYTYESYSLGQIDDLDNEEKPEFDFSLSANNYHISNFEKVEKLAMEIRELDKSNVSLVDEINYVQDHLFSCLYHQDLELDEIVKLNPAFEATPFPTEQPFIDFSGINYRDDDEIIDRVSTVYDYLVHRLETIKGENIMTEGTLEDISLAENGLVIIKDYIDQLTDLNDKLDECNSQFRIRYNEWKLIRDTLSYPDPYSSVYDPVSEVAEDYFYEYSNNYNVHVSEMESFDENNLSENWDQLPFDGLSSEQVEKTVKTKSDVWTNYQDMGKTMQGMFDSPY